MKPAIAQVVLGLPVEGPFDYTLSRGQQDKVAAGERVFVSFGQQRLVGFIVGFKKSSRY